MGDYLIAIFYESILNLTVSYVCIRRRQVSHRGKTVHSYSKSIAVPIDRKTSLWNLRQIFRLNHDSSGVVRVRFHHFVKEFQRVSEARRVRSVSNLIDLSSVGEDILRNRTTQQIGGRWYDSIAQWTRG